MRSIKAIGIIVVVTIGWKAAGQDFHFSQFMQNMIYVNPASVAMAETGEIGLTYRNQWPGIPATFVTYGSYLAVPVSSLSSGMGIHFLNDMQGSGVINRTSASLQYGYLFRINREWQVAAGLGASYVFKRFSADQLVFRSDILNDLGYGTGNVTLENYNRSYPDFNVGIIARNTGGISFGFSASHVTRPKESLSSQEYSRLPVKYTAFVSGRIAGGDNSNSSGIIVEPAVYYSQQQTNHELVWGSQFLIASTFMLGGWMRQSLNFSPEALIISAGISWERYNISYSYDVNLKKMHFLSTKMAAHEVTFLYRFEYKDKNFKKADCPAYL